MLIKKRCKQLILFGILLLFLPLCLLSPIQLYCGTWETKSPMIPEATVWSATCELEGRIYIISGWNNTSSPAPLNVMQVYDAITDSWIENIELPAGSNGASACAVDRKIYMIGGRTGTICGVDRENVFEFDPVNKKWTEKAPLPEAKSFSCAVAVDGKIYSIGGRCLNRDNIKFFRKVPIYDPVTNTWTEAEGEMPEHRDSFAAAVVNDKIYVIGGECSYDGRGRKSVFEYDPRLNEWKKKQDMPTARLYMTAATVNGNIYVMGGLEKYHPPTQVGLTETSLTVNEVYDPATDTWSTESHLPTPRAGHCCEVFKDKIYLFGGVEKIDPQEPVFPIPAIVEEYTPLGTSVENISLNKPVRISLHQNYPNPFNPTTMIMFSIPEPHFSTIRVYDSSGREIEVLVSQFFDRGTYSIRFDAGNLASGTYFYRLRSGTLVETQKMLLVR